MRDNSRFYTERLNRWEFRTTDVRECNVTCRRNFVSRDHRRNTDKYVRSTLEAHWHFAEAVPARFALSHLSAAPSLYRDKNIAGVKNALSLVRAAKPAPSISRAPVISLLPLTFAVITTRRALVTVAARECRLASALARVRKQSNGAKSTR